MVEVIYKGKKLKALNDIEEFRDHHCDANLVSEDETLIFWMRNLFPEEYKKIYDKIQDNDWNGGFSKEYVAARTIYARYEDEANKVINWMNISNREVDRINFNTLTHIFKNVLNIKDFEIKILSSPEATEEELWQMKNIIY